MNINIDIKFLKLASIGVAIVAIVIFLAVSTWNWYVRDVFDVVLARNDVVPSLVNKQAAKEALSECKCFPNSGVACYSKYEYRDEPLLQCSELEKIQEWTPAKSSNMRKIRWW